VGTPEHARAARSADPAANGWFRLLGRENNI
jgi:hypothetical protein